MKINIDHSYEHLLLKIESSTKDCVVIELIDNFRKEQQRIMNEPIEFKNRVCELSGCTPEEINSHSRKRIVVRARQIINVAFIHVFGMTLSESGRQINHDHATYYFSARSIQNDFETDSEYRELFKEIFDKYPEIKEGIRKVKF